jgi:cellulase
LEFFKIDGVGLIDDTTVPGTWADDQLIANNNTWAVTIPSDIAPGHYVLRHEIIALHSAGETNGAQNYPQCFNLEVTGSGTATPAGTLGTALYTADEAGILVNIYQTLASYLVPGPALYSGAANSSEPAVPVATASATVSGEVSSGSAAPTSVAATSTLPVSAGITAPAGSYPTGAPYSNSTATRTKKTKSACKVKTKASTAVSVPTFASSVTIPTAASTPTIASGSDESSSTIAKAATTSSATSSKIPSGTTLDTVLAWIASFYTERKDTEYSGASVARRQHARAIIPRRVPQ